MEAGRDDSRIVAEKRVAGLQVPGQIPELAMLDSSFGPVHDEQPRVIPPGDRALGNKGFRQRIIKKVGLQGRSDVDEDYGLTIENQAPA